MKSCSQQVRLKTVSFHGNSSFWIQKRFKMDFKKKYDTSKRFETLEDAFPGSGGGFDHYSLVKEPTLEEMKQWEEKRTTPEGPGGWESHRPDTQYSGKTPFNVLSELNAQAFVPLDVLHQRMKLDMRTWEEYDDFTRNPAEPTRVVQSRNREGGYFEFCYSLIS
jgi:hypothetical protein